MSDVAPLQAPQDAPLVLTAPAPVQAVATTQAPRIAPPVPAEAVPALDQKVAGYMQSLLTEQPGSPEFSAKADDVRFMGDAEIRKAAQSSNRFLAQPVREMKEGGLAEGSKVGAALLELRRTVEDLDPSTAPTGKKILGFIPFGKQMDNYFRKYQDAQTHLNAIIQALFNGQDELRKDNAALNLEKKNLWETMGNLNQYIYIAEALDTQVSAHISEVEATDPEKARALREDVLFYVRQKHQDLLTQLAVTIQGYLAMDIIIKNNLELIKGVDRATTTTVSALRTAVTVAQALANQRLVLDQITALNTTTGNMIETTSRMLRDQSAQIQQQAASSTVGLPQLQAAFENIYATMDAISDFKLQALDNMAQTIGVLETETAKAHSYIDRVQRGDKQNPNGGILDLGTGAGR